MTPAAGCIRRIHAARAAFTATAAAVVVDESEAVESHFILYVADQARSARFYANVLALAPRLDVPGMTEFVLPDGGVLGLMPAAGIKALLGAALPDPSGTGAAPRCELYLLVDEPAWFHARALAFGARELSSLVPRTWGHTAAYSLDHDGHVLAFASPTDPPETGSNSEHRA